MKKTLTSLSFLAKQAISKGVLILLVAVFFAVPVFSQDLNDLNGVTWKTTADLSASLAQESAQTDVTLAQPGLPAVDQAIFKAYKRLLGYVQSDLQANVPVADAIVKNYEKVIAEAPKDADLAEMPEGVLATYLSGLVEALSAVQNDIPIAPN